MAEAVTPHSDTGKFTLIYYGSRGCEGLEVQDQETKEWIRIASADVPPGAFIFIGDALRTLSGNVSASSVSRRPWRARRERGASRSLTSSRRLQRAAGAGYGGLGGG